MTEAEMDLLSIILAKGDRDKLDPLLDICARVYEDLDEDSQYRQ